MATTRLRKTFQYPADDSEDDDVRRDLDEEEQEKLIARLRAADEERNEQYTRFFLTIPLAACLAYIPALLTSPSYLAKFTSLLAITSLLVSAYTLLFIPLPSKQIEDPKGKRPMRDLEPEPEPSPLKRYLDFLNGALSLLVSLNGTRFRDRPDMHAGFWLLCFIPSLVLVVVVTARRLMQSVNVTELEGLKYQYKGA